jgi:hypothetical protein
MTYEINCFYSTFFMPSAQFSYVWICSHMLNQAVHFVCICDFVFMVDGGGEDPIWHVLHICIGWVVATAHQPIKDGFYSTTRELVGVITCIGTRMLHTPWGSSVLVHLLCNIRCKFFGMVRGHPHLNYIDMVWQTIGLSLFFWKNKVYVTRLIQENRAKINLMLN